MSAPVETLPGLVEGMVECRFTVYGQAKPAGSKRAFKHPKTGQLIVTEDSKNRSWRQEVAKAGLEAVGQLGAMQLGPLFVEFVFFRPRPSGHYGTGKNAGVVKGSAPEHPTTRPDVLKLARAAEDSLTGILYKDDAQIVHEVLVKAWGEPERLEVLVRPL